LYWSAIPCLLIGLYVNGNDDVLRSTTKTKTNKLMKGVGGRRGRVKI